MKTKNFRIKKLTDKPSSFDYIVLVEDKFEWGPKDSAILFTLMQAENIKSLLDFAVTIDAICPKNREVTGEIENDTHI